MAIRDIMPYASPHGGGLERNVAWQIENNGTTVTATFRIGELVVVDANGQIDEVAAGQVSLTTTTKGTTFLALEDAVANIRRIGDARYGNTPSPAYPCTVATFDPDCEYITRNAFNGTDTNIGPAGTNTLTTTNVGDACGLRVTAGGVHGLDLNTVTGFRISRILDSQGRDTYISGAATAFIVIRPDF